VSEPLAERTTAEAWRQSLLRSVLDELEAAAALRTAASTAGRSEFADVAAKQLQQTYLARARLLSVSVDAAQATSPAAALSLSIGSLAAGDAEAQLPYVQEAAQYLAGDDLHLTVAWQRMLIELSVRRIAQQRPQRAAAARQLEAESLAASASAKGVLQQLRDQEQTLLQLWMLYAPEL
jgi:hypothetical protein